MNAAKGCEGLIYQQIQVTSVHPCAVPATEKVWQGGVANMTSTSGNIWNDEASRIVMSCGALKGLLTTELFSTVGYCSESLKAVKLP